MPSPQPRHSLARSTSCYINQSLSALGMVIKELSEAMAKTAAKTGAKLDKNAVPFRASKLTFLAALRNGALLLERYNTPTVTRH